MRARAEENLARQHLRGGWEDWASQAGPWAQSSQRIKFSDFWLLF